MGYKAPYSSLKFGIERDEDYDDSHPTVILEHMIRRYTICIIQVEFLYVHTKLERIGIS